jgi:hypothetical protein
VAARRAGVVARPAAAGWLAARGAARAARGARAARVCGAGGAALLPRRGGRPLPRR